MGLFKHFGGVCCFCLQGDCTWFRWMLRSLGGLTDQPTKNLTKGGSLHKTQISIWLGILPCKMCGWPVTWTPCNCNRNCAYGDFLSLGALIGHNFCYMWQYLGEWGESDWEEELCQLCKRFQGFWPIRLIGREEWKGSYSKTLVVETSKWDKQHKIEDLCGVIEVPFFWDVTHLGL